MNENDPIHLTRATLLERVRLQHDEKSWEDFVFYYRHFIYIICRRLNQSHHDAEEITQAVLLKLWSKLPTFEYDKKSRFRSWLYSVTKNSVRDFCRKQTRTAEIKDKAGDYQIWNFEGQVTQPQVDALAEKEWSNYISNMALNNVRDQFAEKVIDIFLRLAQGIQPKELGEELGIPRNTIAVYKKRVLLKLKDEVARLEEELG